MRVRPVPRLGGELETVLADDRDARDAQHPLDVGARPPAHARDEGVAPGQPGELAARLVGHARVLRPLDDGRERAVDVEQHGSARGVLREPGDKVVRHGRA